MSPLEVSKIGVLSAERIIVLQHSVMASKADSIDNITKTFIQGLVWEVIPHILLLSFHQIIKFSVLYPTISLESPLKSNLLFKIALTTLVKHHIKYFPAD